MTDLNNLVPSGEKVWMSYYNRDTLLYFLTGPSKMTSSMTANSEAFTLYTVANDGKKAKKLGSGGNPRALEEKYKIVEAMRALAKAS